MNGKEKEDGQKKRCHADGKCRGLLAAWPMPVRPLRSRTLIDIFPTLNAPPKSPPPPTPSVSAICVDILVTASSFSSSSPSSSSSFCCCKSNHRRLLSGHRTPCSAFISSNRWTCRTFLRNIPQFCFVLFFEGFGCSHSRMLRLHVRPIQPGRIAAFEKKNTQT